MNALDESSQMILSNFEALLLLRLLQPQVTVAALGLIYCGQAPLTRTHIGRV